MNQVPETGSTSLSTLVYIQRSFGTLSLSLSLSLSLTHFIPDLQVLKPSNCLNGAKIPYLSFVGSCLGTRHGNAIKSQTCSTEYNFECPSAPFGQVLLRRQVTARRSHKLQWSLAFIFLSIRMICSFSDFKLRSGFNLSPTGAKSFFAKNHNDTFAFVSTDSREPML